MGERVLKVALKGSRKHSLIRFFAVIRQRGTLSGYKRGLFLVGRIDGATYLHITTGYDVIFHYIPTVPPQACKLFSFQKPIIK